MPIASPIRKGEQNDQLGPLFFRVSGLIVRLGRILARRPRERREGDEMNVSWPYGRR